MTHFADNIWYPLGVQSVVREVCMDEHRPPPVALNFEGIKPSGPRFQSQAPCVVPDGRLLIFTGPSGFGSHRVGEFIRCPHRYALVHEPTLRPQAGHLDGVVQKYIELLAELSRVGSEAQQSTDFTRRGTLFHVGVSHFYARMGCRQGGVLVDGTHYNDEDLFYLPEEACDLAAQRIPDAFKVLGTSLALLKRYIEWASRRREGRIHAVETVYTLPLSSGRYHTARIDLVTQDELTQAIRFVDHKVLNRARGAPASYQSSLQILAHKAIGRHAYPQNFGGVWINAVDAKDDGSTSEIAVYRDRVPRAPGLERDAVRLLDKTRSEIARLREAGTPLSQWIRVPVSDRSWRGCSRCPVWDQCVFGA